MFNRSTLLIALLAASAAAHADGRPFAVAGIGELSCGAYLAESASNRATDGWWLAGFITGENAAKNRAGGAAADAAAAQAWVDEYCRAHALDLFVMAAVRLDEELDRRAKAAATKAR